MWGSSTGATTTPAPFVSWCSCAAETEIAMAMAMAMAIAAVRSVSVVLLLPLPSVLVATVIAPQLRDMELGYKRKGRGFMRANPAATKCTLAR